MLRHHARNQMTRRRADTQKGRFFLCTFCVLFLVEWKLIRNFVAQNEYEPCRDNNDKPAERASIM